MAACQTVQPWNSQTLCKPLSLAVSFFLPHINAWHTVHGARANTAGQILMILSSACVLHIERVFLAAL